MTEPISFLRISDVADRTSLGKSTILRLVSKGLFPAPIRLLGRNSAYPSNLVDQWIAEQIEADQGIKPAALPTTIRKSIKMTEAKPAMPAPTPNPAQSNAAFVRTLYSEVTPGELTFEAYSSFASSLVLRPAQGEGEDAGLFDVEHGVVGLASEVGEVAGTLKRHMVYQVPLDYPNILEECGDILFYLNMLVRGAGYTLADAARANEAKLRLRHGASFNHEAAVGGRDLAAEREILESFQRCA